MTFKPRKVGVFFGGPSTEYEVSRVSALSIAKALEQAGHTVLNIGVGRNGRWYGPIPTEAITNFESENHLEEEIVAWSRPGTALYSVKDGSIVCELDIAFPIIHGRYGEDGHLQALFDMMGLPFVGAPMAASAVGMDKVYMRDILESRGLPQVLYVPITRGQWEQNPQVILDNVKKKLDLPIFVKPANAGSSVGITKVTNFEGLEAAADKAFEVDRKILFEQGREVRELEVSVLGNESTFLAGPGEVVAGAEFYDYEAKYQSSISQTLIPADIPKEVREEVHALSREVYKALDLRGLSRIDFFLTKDTAELLVNEVNTLPGFTSISMYAKLWEAEGKSLPALVAELIELALARSEEERVYDPALSPYDRKEDHV